MTVKIRLFAIMAEQAHTRELTMGVPESTKVGEIRDLLKSKYSHVTWPPGTLLAVNQEYVSAQRPLQEGDELAIIPPVSGG